MSSSRRVFGGAMIRPGRTFGALSSDPKRFRKGVRATLALGFFYILSAALLGSGGALVPAPALLPLSPQNYYFYQMIFVLPFLAVLWLLSSTFSHGLSKILDGRGGWKTTASGLAFAFAIPALMVWIPPVVFGVLLHTGMPQPEFMELFSRPGWLQTGGWIYHGLAAAWMVYLSAAALRAGHGFSRLKAGLAGLLTSAFYVAGFLIIIR